MSSVPNSAAIPLELYPQDHCLAVYSISEGAVRYGFYAGTPSVHVRLQGCPVGCQWCDQPQGIPEPGLIDVEQQATEEDLEQGDGRRGYRWVGSTRLLALIESHACRHVVITGGEPALYDLALFTEQLLDRGYTVQVETSGTLPLSVHRDVWVTLSPKHQQNPATPVWDWIYKRADEILLPITRPSDARWLDRALKARRMGSIIWLQPLHGRNDLNEICWHLAQKHWVRVALPVQPLPHGH